MIVEVRRVEGETAPTPDALGELVIRCYSGPESDPTQDPGPASALSGSPPPIESGTWKALGDLIPWLSTKAEIESAGEHAVWSEVPLVCKGPEGERTEYLSARQDWVARTVLSEVLRLVSLVEEPERLWVLVK